MLTEYRAISVVVIGIASFPELRVRFLVSFARSRPRVVGCAHELHPRVTGGVLHLAKLLHRLVALPAKVFELLLRLRAHVGLRSARLFLPLTHFRVPLVELIL